MSQHRYRKKHTFWTIGEKRGEVRKDLEMERKVTGRVQEGQEQENHLAEVDEIYLKEAKIFAYLKGRQVLPDFSEIE